MALQSILLSTKLHVPLPKPGMVIRPKLIRRLDEAFQKDTGLILLSAPAGYGKTTLLSQWLSGAGWSKSGTSVLWLSLDEGDDDGTGFFSYFIAALRRIDPRIGEGVEDLIGTFAPSPHTLMTLLINDLVSITHPILFVLDDYHYIKDKAIHQALSFLLDQGLPHMRLAILTREDPPFPLARLRVRDQLMEIRACELRFAEREITLFFNTVLGIRLEKDLIATLEAKTEGWIAALKLVSLSFHDSEDIDSIFKDFSGADKTIIDYLYDEVFTRQGRELQAFLCGISIPDRFCASLCAALFGEEAALAEDNTQNIQMLLERLERNNLFVLPLDDHRRWYRFHGLFADFLRSRLSPEMAGKYHLRAALWFERQGLWNDAVKHILAYTKFTGITQDAVRIVEAAGLVALSEGALVRLLGWINALPDRVVRGELWLSCFKAWCLIMTGRGSEAGFYIRNAETRLSPYSPDVDRGRVLSLRCSISDADYITRTAPVALGLIGDADPLTRTGLLFTLGDAQDDLGEVLGAERAFSEAWKLGQLHGFKAMGAIALAHCALSVNYQGRRGAALALCKKGMEEYRDSRGKPLPIAGLLYVVAGELAYEENALERALRLLETGVGLGKLSAMPRITLYGMNELARAFYACGERKAAIKNLKEARLLASQAGEEGWISSLGATEAAIALREGSRDIVFSWVEQLDLPNNAPLDQTRKHEYSVMIRVFLKTGQVLKAKALLPLLEEAAAAQGRKRHLISIFIQRALVEELLGQRELALSYLDKALSLARKEVYLRAFLDEGEALANLLNKWPIKSDSFVSRLREGFMKEALCKSNYMPRDVEAQGEALLEPLSDRELEVLRLLRTKLSTPQIAEKLYVSSSTVRSHIKHIYVKLDVHSRFEALQRAKEFGLI